MAHAITVKYFGPINTKGSRLKVESPRGSTWFSYDHILDAQGNRLAAIYEHLNKMYEPKVSSGSPMERWGFNGVIAELPGNPNIHVAIIK